MKKILETSAIAFAAVLALAAPMTAHAGCGVCPQCDPTDNDREQATRTIDEIKARIQQLEDKLVETLKKHAQQTTGAIEKVGPQVAEALNGHIRALKDMELERQQAQAMKEHMTSKSGCGSTTQAEAFRDAEVGTKKALQEIFTESNDRTSATGWVPGGGVPPSGPGKPVGAADDIAQRFDKLQDYRNTKEDVNPGKTLFGNRTIGKETPVDRTGVSASNPPGAQVPTELKAANELINNITTPIKQDPAPMALTDPATATPAGKQAYVRLRSNEGREELAKAALQLSVAMRDPSVDKNKVAEILNDPSFQLATTDQDVVNDKISQFYLTDIVMNQKYQNPKWHAELWKDGLENVQRQMAQMMAFSLMLQWKQYQLIEQLTAIESTKLAMDLEVARGGGAQVQPLPSR